MTQGEKKGLRRRTVLLGAVFALGASGIAVLELLPRERKRLAIDPEGTSLVYEDGWIVKA